MPVVLPFRGVRYDPARVPIHQVVAPPYDVISPAERAQLHQRHPANVVRLILGEERPQDNEQENRYRRAALFWRSWREQGLLRTEITPTYYVYRQQFPYRGRQWTRLGFLGRLHLEPLDGGMVRAHEQTRSTPKEELYRLLVATAANFSPVFALFHDTAGRVREQLERVTQSTPIYDFTDDAQVRQTLWSTPPPIVPQLYQALWAEPIVIADGHHRYESRLRYAAWRQAQQTAGGVDAFIDQQLPRAGFWYSLTYFVASDDSGLLILPTHRLVRPQAGLAVRGQGWLETVIQQLPGSAFEVQRLLPAGGQPSTPPATGEGRRQWFTQRVEDVLLWLEQGGEVGGQAAISSNRRWTLPRPHFAVVDGKGEAALFSLNDGQRMAEAAPGFSQAWRQLDVAVLHRLVLDPLLEEGGPAAGAELEYTQAAERVAAALADGEAEIAFLLPFPRPDQVEEVAAAGEKMPAKSTFFHPKLLSGLVMDDLEIPVTAVPCGGE
ncbi:MAG: DUF1015 domain-containing protein [Limnochordaceae bacterium]|nr:DUF1015 domain-containing protein [Limnochordaceae bacterium]